MDKIVPAFETSLFDNTLSDACLDIAELGIDGLLDEGIFRSIPIVSILVGAGKTAQNIYERNLLRQTIKFINTFNERSIAPGKLDKYKRRIKENPRFAEEELGRVIILLNSNIDSKKSALLAKFYRAFVEEIIGWDTFCELSDVTNRLFISDINLLNMINRQEVKDTTQCETYRAERLVSIGLVNSDAKNIIIGTSTGDTQHFLKTSKLGQLFCSLSE